MGLFAKPFAEPIGTPNSEDRANRSGDHRSVGKPAIPPKRRNEAPRGGTHHGPEEDVFLADHTIAIG